MGRRMKDLQLHKREKGQTSPLPLQSPEQNVSRRRKVPPLRIAIPPASNPSPSHLLSPPDRVYLKPKTRKAINCPAEPKKSIVMATLSKSTTGIDTVQQQAWNRPLTPKNKPQIIPDEIYHSDSSSNQDPCIEYSWSPPLQGVHDDRSPTIRFLPGKQKQRKSHFHFDSKQKTPEKSGYGWLQQVSPIINVDSMSEPSSPTVTASAPAMTASTPPPAMTTSASVATSMTASTSPPQAMTASAPAATAVTTSTPVQDSAEAVAAAVASIPVASTASECCTKISPTAQLLIDAGNPLIGLTPSQGSRPQPEDTSPPTLHLPNLSPAPAKQSPNVSSLPPNLASEVDLLSHQVLIGTYWYLLGLIVSSGAEPLEAAAGHQKPKALASALDHNSQS